MTLLRTLFTTLLPAALLLLASSDAAHAQRRTIRIGAVADGPTPANVPILKTFQREIAVLTRGEFKVLFPKSKTLVADWTADGVAKAIDGLLADPKVNLVLCMGTLASNDCGRRQKLSKPVIAPFVIDPKLQGIPLTKRGTSGRANLAYLALPQTFERDLQVFRDLLPFTKLAVLTNGSLTAAVPGYEERMRKKAKDMGFAIHVIPLFDSADEALAKLPDDVDAVYVRSVLTLSKAQQKALTDGLRTRKLPSFSLLGYSGVQSGLLAGTRPQSDFTVYARHTALHVQRILLGGNPARFKVALPLNEQLTINMGTARAIGFTPGWDVLTDAVLINESRSDLDRTESLTSVVEAALKNNIDLAAARQVVAVSKYSAQEARSGLLPSIEASTLARQIDENTAESSLGLQPQRLWTGSISAQWNIAEPLFAGHESRKRVQAAREHEYQQTKVDVVSAVTIAYLNVLRAKTLERIQRQNLSATRSNLTLSRSRIAVGSGAKSEVYRFESQLANDRRSVIEASNRRSVAEAALNRILNRPVDEPFATSDTTLEDESVLAGHKKLFTYIENPVRFAAFRNFLIAEAVAVAPRLKALDSAISAQERQVTSKKLAYFMPKVALIGRYNRQLYTGGIGSDGTNLPGIGVIELPVQNWFVGVNLSVPLFSGGGDYARSAGAQAELSRLKLQRDSARNRVREQVFSQVQLLSTAHAAISLSRDSAEAARKNLDLVSDAYGKGAATIIQIIDAQNVARIADQVAANAVYDFLIQWMNVQRAFGRVDLLMSASEIQEFFRRADDFMAGAE